MEDLFAGPAALRETVALAAHPVLWATTRTAAAAAVSGPTGLPALADALVPTPLIDGRARAVVSVRILRDALVHALQAGLLGSLWGVLLLLRRRLLGEVRLLRQKTFRLNCSGTCSSSRRSRLLKGSADGTYRKHTSLLRQANEFTVANAHLRDPASRAALLQKMARLIVRLFGPYISVSQMMMIGIVLCAAEDDEDLEMRMDALSDSQYFVHFFLVQPGYLTTHFLALGRSLRRTR